MAKKFKTIRGIKFAHDVDTSGIDWESSANVELVEALKRKPKIRITTMLDVDVLESLKRLAAESEDKMGYQTVMNALLRAILFPAPKAKKRPKSRRAG